MIIIDNEKKNLLLEQYDNDNDMVELIIEDGLVEITEKVSIINNLLNNDSPDYDTIAIKLHNLKTNAKYLMEEPLAELAKDTEQLIKSANIEENKNGIHSKINEITKYVM